MIEFIKQHGQTLIEAGGAVIMIGVFAGAFFGGGVLGGGKKFSKWFSAAATMFSKWLYGM